MTTHQSTNQRARLRELISVAYKVSPVISGDSIISHLPCPFEMCPATDWTARTLEPVEGQIEDSKQANEHEPVEMLSRYNVPTTQYTPLSHKSSPLL